MKNENTQGAQHGTAAQHLNSEEPGYAGVLIFYGRTVVLGKRIEICPYTKRPPTFAGYWSPFCGAIEKEESPVEAAARELKEETGIVVKTEELTFMSKIRDLALFAKTTTDFLPIQLDYEHTEYGYFKISQLHNSPTPMDEELIQAIKIHSFLN